MEIIFCWIMIVFLLIIGAILILWMLGLIIVLIFDCFIVSNKESKLKKTDKIDYSSYSHYPTGSTKKEDTSAWDNNNINLMSS